MFLLALLFSITANATIDVLVIDTGISSVQQLKPYLATKDADTNGHGTHIASLIALGKNLRDPVCNNVRIYSCSYLPDTNDTNNCFKQALKRRYDFINFSGGGKGYDPIEHLFISLLPKTTTLVVAAGNDGKNIEHGGYYPAALPGIRNKTVVGNLDGSLRHSMSNYGWAGMEWEQGVQVMGLCADGGICYATGTSQATALYTHKLIQARCSK